MVSYLDLWGGNSTTQVEQARDVVAKMEHAYAQIGGYQTETEIEEFRSGKLMEKRKFLYSFKKPNHIRIDMEDPYSGMVLVYPGKGGKVTVKPGGWIGFLKLHLSVDNTILTGNSGQRIDQTDLGLLIRNISHSLTDRRHGEIKITVQDGRTTLEVLAEDHFLTEEMTLYRFTVDNNRWLPMEVMELTQDGIPKRQVVFRNFRAVDDMPDKFFNINGEEP